MTAMPDLFLTADPFELHCVFPILRREKISVQLFEIKGNPVAMERPVTFTRGGKSMTFTPARSRNWKNHVALSVMGQRPIKCPAPYTVIIKFICDPNLAKTDGGYPVAPKHGDLDNLAKSILDALFGPKDKLFQDDREIVNLITYKRFPEVGGTIGVKIWIVDEK